MRGYYGYGFPGGAGYTGMAGFPWFSIVMMVIGVAIVAAIIYFAVKASRDRGAIAPKTDEALEILAARFAKGEISKEEYLEARDFLKKN
ncbi:MAG: SHOCT domain-containing protein [Spirochaetales bacterium]|jgi:putative membrane protein